MLVDRVLADLDIPGPDERQGNPLRGSRLGRCARQSAYMMFPDAYPPEPLPARAKLVFTFGNLVHEYVRAEFRRVVPGQWGMEEERFHFKVPLTTKDAKAAQRMIDGRVLPGMRFEKSPGPGEHGRGQWRRGLWLNAAEPAIYIPLHVDGIADLSPFGGEGLASVEIKSMATGSFRRAVQGHVEYSYRVQMAAAVDATGLDTEMYVAVRKDTSHMLEVIYTKKASDIAVTFTKQAHMATMLGLTLDEGVEWEAAEVRHPFEPHLLEQARERVRRILRSSVTHLPEREYGPSFACETCEGTGMQAKAKSTGQPLKNGPKPCPDCEKRDVPVEGGVPLTGVGVPSGRVARAGLPWTCRYCAFVTHCWPIAKLAIEDERPKYWVTREDFEASGITFKSPEAA